MWTPLKPARLQRSFITWPIPPLTICPSSPLSIHLVIIMEPCPMHPKPVALRSSLSAESHLYSSKSNTSGESETELFPSIRGLSRANSSHNQSLDSPLTSDGCMQAICDTRAPRTWYTRPLMNLLITPNVRPSHNALRMLWWVLSACGKNLSSSMFADPAITTPRSLTSDRSSDSLLRKGWTYTYLYYWDVLTKHS